MWECKPLWLRRWSRPERADIRSALTVLAAVVPGRHALLIGRTLMGISNPRIADRRHGLCQQGDAPEIDRLGAMGGRLITGMGMIAAGRGRECHLISRAAGIRSGNQAEHARAGPACRLGCQPSIGPSRKPPVQTDGPSTRSTSRRSTRRTRIGFHAAA